MHWTHEDPGQNALQWTVGHESDVVLEFSATDVGRWEVNGFVAGNPDTYTCSTSHESSTCELQEISDGLIQGEAFESGGVLAVELTWRSEAYPVEIGEVVVQGPLSPIVGDEELAVLNTDLVSEFIGQQWQLPLVEAVFLDDAAILDSDLTSGSYADVDLTYGLPGTDRIVQEWQSRVAAKTFATETPLYGVGYGTFYLFGGHPGETVMRDV